MLYNVNHGDKAQIRSPFTIPDARGVLSPLSLMPMTSTKEIQETFGLYFKRLRKKTRPNVSQKEAADAAGVTQQYVSLIERTAGTIEEPEVDWEVAINLALAVGGTREGALKAHGRDPNSPKFSDRVAPDHATILVSGEIAYLNSASGRKILLTDDLMKRLNLESELQEQIGERK